MNVNSLVTANGSFSLAAGTLASLAGNWLSDGSYRLSLQSRDAAGQAISFLTVPFTLDLTPPNLSVSGLLDGIAWDQENGEQLEGEVLNWEPGTSVVYYLDEDESQAVPLVLGATGGFNRLVPLEHLPLGRHTLTVKSSDIAGNAQTIDYRFQVKQDTPPVDNDPDTSDPQSGTSNNQGGNGYPNLGFWGTGWGGGGSNGGWGWLNLGGGGGNPDYWSPPLSGNGYGPSEPPIPYVERIQEILQTATQAMPFGTRRGALKRRMAALNELASTVEQGSLYDEMQYSLYGIYYLASQIETRSQAKNIGHFLATQLKDDNDPAVRVQALQTTLLAAVTEALDVNQPGGLTLNPQQVEGLAQAVMEMAYTYAMWNPTEPEAGQITPGFLNELWQSQLVGGTGKFNPVVIQIRELLTGVNEPAKALNFINNLLKATNEVDSLRDDLKDPVFLKELIQFGFHYAKLNPDTSLSNEPQGFLDVLWRAQPDDTAAIKTGAAGLSDFFDGANTQAKLVKRLTFAKDLIEAAKLAPSTQGQVKDPQFVDALIGLGSAYAKLEPIESEVTNQDLKFFLDTVLRGRNIQKGSNELATFLSLPGISNNQILALTYQKKLLATMRRINSFQGDLNDIALLSAISTLATASTLHYLSLGASKRADSYSVSGAVWDAISNEDLSIVAQNMQTYINTSKAINSVNDILIATFASLQTYIGSKPAQPQASLLVSNPPIPIDPIPGSDSTTIEARTLEPEIQRNRTDLRVGRWTSSNSENWPKLSSITNRSTTPLVEVASKKALIVAPFVKSDNLLDASLPYTKNEISTIQEVLRKESFQIELIGVSETTENKYDDIIEILRSKDLGDYGVIVWAGHGFAAGQQDFFLNTDYPVTIESVNRNRQDILDRSLLFRGKYSNDLSAGELSIGSGFITTYSTNQNSNSIVYISTCESLLNNSMSDSFLSIGAGAFFGYTLTTGDEWAYEHGEALFRALSTGRATSPNEIPGLNDKEFIVRRFPGAEFAQRGEQNIVLVKKS